MTLTVNVNVTVCESVSMLIIILITRFIAIVVERLNLIIIAVESVSLKSFRNRSHW